VSDGTQPYPFRGATRREWRDAVKKSVTNPTTRSIALCMAEFWPKAAEGYLWCAVSTIIEQTGRSRATVYRALSDLQADGWLLQVQQRAQHRSPRYLPTIPSERIGQEEPADPWADFEPPPDPADEQQFAAAEHPWAEVALRGLIDGLQRSHSETPEVSPRDLNLVRIATDSSNELSRPADRERPKFSDWRADDRALFIELVGPSMRSDGIGEWSKGNWTAEAWYEAFRKRHRNPHRWPGRYFDGLEDVGGLDDYLDALGLTRANAA
jgi:hypothetical protein